MNEYTDQVLFHTLNLIKKKSIHIKRFFAYPFSEKRLSFKGTSPPLPTFPMKE